MLAVTTWILAATGALVDAQTIPTPTAYSYSYTTETPTMAPTTETMAPTRTETYAPSRMTEAPSYAPTTETYAPSSSPTSTAAPTCNASCPPDILAVPTSMCPEDATDIEPRPSDVGPHGQAVSRRRRTSLSPSLLGRAKNVRPL